MRHIQHHDHAPDPDWCKRADSLLGDLKAAQSLESRNAIIDANKSLWRELLDWLLNKSHGKCWFSEAKDCFNHWDVEHFRPKKKAKDESGGMGEGYWWLAFDWHNLRICGNVGNRKKGTYFPLRSGSKQADPFGDLRYEEPLLLDPADEDDPNLLCFDFEGKAIAAPHVIDAWELERVRYSVFRYKLNYSPLSNRRKLVWAECWRQIQSYCNELSLVHADPGNRIAREGMRQAAKSIRKMILQDKEFSAVARACIASSGDPRVLCLLMT